VIGDARLALVYQQLGQLLAAGIGMPETLALLVRRSRGELRSALGAVRDALESGAGLADALATAPALFPETTRALVAAGEATGGLPAIFLELAEAARARLALRRRVIRACVYPFLLFSLSFFLPPLSRLVTAGVGAYLRASLVPYLVALLVIGALLLVARRLPLPGSLRLLASRRVFASQLASAWRAGLGAHAALAIAGRATGDAGFEKGVNEASARVKNGATLEEALAATHLFDDDFLLAVAGGEKAGTLDVSLATHARVLDETRLHRLDLFVQVLAVAILLGVYAWVGWKLYADMRALLQGPSQELLQELDPELLLTPRLGPEFE
jgi:type II secretory pathway component PulF